MYYWHTLKNTLLMFFKFFGLLINARTLNKFFLFCSGLEKILREQRVLYGKNLDITSYDGERETHNPAGRFSL